MIINKITKGIQTRSDKPNENWLNGEDYFVVQDGTELAKKIISLYPYYDFVTDERDSLIDVIEVEHAQPEPIPDPEPTAEGVTWEAMADAIKEGVNEV
jgi:hypothetical protein